MLSLCYASPLFLDYPFLFFFYLLATVPCNKALLHCTPHGGPFPFLLVATLIPVAQLVYKALVDILYLLILNLLCIPFLLLLTHPQALRLRLQPELLGHNIRLSITNSLL